MKKRLSLKFIRFATDPRKFPIYSWIMDNYEVVDGEHPDFIVDFGHPYLHHWYDDSVKILFENENNVPNFNAYDYAVGFDYMDFGDRYLRVPLFARYPAYARYENPVSMSDDKLLNRGFCSFVVSNPWKEDHIRTKFCKRLSQYKEIASGGRFMNNVGGPVPDKIQFLSKYKFNISFENTPSLGYTTEKIMDAYAGRSIPIYWGNPTIETDFCLDSMIRVQNENDIDRAIEEIVRLDNDDAEYLRVVKSKALVAEDINVYKLQIEDFLTHIFQQPPYMARRRNHYGYQPALQRNISNVMRVDYRLLELRKKLRKWHIPI